MSRILQPFHLRAACRRLGPPALVLALAGVVAVVIAPITEAAAPAAAPLNNCVKTDNGDPKPQTLTRTPTAVNVTTADKTVTFTLGAVDTGGPGAASGISSGFLGLQSPDNQRSAYASLTRNAAGKWVGTATIPRWTHGGVWHLSYLSLSDNAGNYALLVGGRAGGSRNQWQRQRDRDRRQHSAQPERLHLHSRLREHHHRGQDRHDDGRTSPMPSPVSTMSTSMPASRQPTTRRFASLTKVAGTATTYRGTMTVPRWQTNGTWHVNSVQVGDKIGNNRTYTYEQLGTAGFKRNLIVVSGTDTTLPTLVTFTRTPAAVDVRTADKTVNATMRVTDTGSGVSYVQLTLRERWRRRQPACTCSGPRARPWTGRGPVVRPSCGASPAQAPGLPRCRSSISPATRRRSTRPLWSRRGSPPSSPSRRPTMWCRRSRVLRR